MGLEAATYISGLVATNPVGATDPKSQGDDHLRLIKSTLLATFPNITGAVTPTHTELNYVDGVTSAIQTQLDGKAASSHNHSAADLTSGTIPDARFPATLPALNGSALTALNATALASGTVADARLSSNVPLKNAANAFTAPYNGINDVAVLLTSATPAMVWDETDAGANNRYWYALVAAGQFRVGAGSDAGSLTEFLTVDRTGATVDSVAIAATSITLNGVVTTDFARLSQSNTFTNATQTVSANGPARWVVNDANSSSFPGLELSRGGTPKWGVFLDSAGSLAVADSLVFYANGLGAVAAEFTAAGNFNFKAGTVTTANASAAEVGKTGSPSRTISASTNTAASDQGGCVRMTGGSGQTFTLDSDVPADCVVLLDNASGNSWTIAASGTLTWALTGGTGSRTLANGGLALALSLGSGNYKITGAGLS